MTTLSRAERKSLALHVRIAERLRNDPSLRAVALRRVDWLRERNPAGRPYYDRWARLLQGPLDRLLGAMLDPSERGCALRQENPFVDLVDQKERARIYRETATAIDSGLRP